MCQKKSCAENQNNFNVPEHFSENRTVCEIMRKNIVEPVKPQMTIKYSACALRAG
jgi:hypothetical protein